MIEAHLANVGGEENEAFDRVASLHRLLNQAVTTGSAPHVVGAFAEALAVWDDIEVRGTSRTSAANLSQRDPRRLGPRCGTGRP